MIGSIIVFVFAFVDVVFSSAVSKGGKLDDFFPPRARPARPEPNLRDSLIRRLINQAFHSLTSERKRGEGEEEEEEPLRLVPLARALRLVRIEAK